MDRSELSVTEIWNILQSFGFTERKFALSNLDDAGLIAQQICTHLGCIRENHHIHIVWELIHDCQLGEPVKKRLRGDHRVDEFQVSEKSLISASIGVRADRSEQPATSTSSRPEVRPLGIKHREVDDQSDARQLRELKLIGRSGQESYIKNCLRSTQWHCRAWNFVWVLTDCI